MRGKNGGPKTKNGKAVASRNAIKHGLRSPHPVIIEDKETEADWDRHRRRILDDLAPEGALEEAFAERIALLFWRLKRVTRYETAVINIQVHSTENDLITADTYAARGAEISDPDPHRVAVYQEKRVIPNADELEKIRRYEAHLHRQLMQTLHELEALQARRRGESTPLARLDVSSFTNS